MFIFYDVRVTLQNDFRVSKVAKYGGVPILRALKTSNNILYSTRALMGTNVIPIAAPPHWCDRSCIYFTLLLLLFAVHAPVAGVLHREYHTINQ